MQWQAAAAGRGGGRGLSAGAGGGGGAVIDEADLVLSFGYDEDVRAVVSCLPRIYQGLLMSATLSPELDDLKRVVLHR